jgi:DNA replication initiation complex subunit (GINS family)
MFLKPLPETSIGGEKIGPFEVDQQADLENWVINVLMDDDIVEIVQDEYEDVIKIQRIYQDEKQQSKLQDIESPLLYAAMRERISHLKGDRTSSDPIRQEGIRRLEDLLENMTEIRLSKVVQTAKAGAYQAMRKQMTYEERWLCEEIIKILSDWRHYTKDEE